MSKVGMIVIALAILLAIAGGIFIGVGMYNASNALYDIHKAATTNGSFEVTFEEQAVSQAKRDTQLTIVPSPDNGYKVKSVSYIVGDDQTKTPVPVFDNNGYKFTMPNDKVTVYVEFEKQSGVLPAEKYDITLDADSTKGEVVLYVDNIPDATQAEKGASVLLKVTPNAEYKVDKVYYVVEDSTEQHNIANTAEGYTFFMPQGNITIYVVYTSVEEQPAQYTISPSPTTNGTFDFTVNGEQAQTAKQGDTIVVNVHPNSNEYYVSQIYYYTDLGQKVNIELQNGEYTFQMPQSNIILSVIFSANKYSITYNLDGGSNVGALTSYTVEDNVTIPNPTKTGYTFAGWEGDASGTDVAWNKGEKTGNLTLTATWTINQYDVTQGVVDGGTFTVSQQGSLDYGTTITVSNIKANEGFSVGRVYYTYVDSFGSQTVYLNRGVTSFSLPAYDIVVYVEFGTETLVVSKQDTEHVTITVEPLGVQQFGATINVTVDSIDQGYQLVGVYYVATDGSHDPYKIFGAGQTTGTFEVPSYNVTVYAVVELQRYDIIYELNDGTAGSNAPNDYNVEENVTISNPTRLGYTFDGWTGTINGKNISWTAGEYTGTITLTANWTAKSYTISYNLNGGTQGSKAPDTYTIEDVISISNPTRLGYTFTGWMGTGLDKPTMNLAWDAGRTGNVELTANWTVDTYTITYNLAGGVAGINAPNSYTVEMTITISNPTKAGYTFAGWTGTISGKDISWTAGERTGAVTLTANWTPNTYDITVNNNGGSGSGLDKQYTVSTNSQQVTLTRPTAPTGMSFDKWTVSWADGTHSGTLPTVSGDTLTIPANCYGNITVTAQWTAKAYSITVNANGGSGGSASKNNYNISTQQQTITLTPPTAPNGYTFASWQVSWTDSDGEHSVITATVSGNTLTIPANVYGDITVTATWNAITYDITFNANGGSGGSASPNTYTISNGQQTVTLTQPTRTGYTFSSWQVSWTDSDNGGALPTVAGDTLTISANVYGNITVTAQWNIITYNITVVDNGGNGGSASPNTYTISNGQQTVTLTQPTRNGYTFASWQVSWTDSDGEHSVITATVSGNTLTIPANVYGDITVTATWNAITYDITFNANGGSGGYASPNTYTISDGEQHVTLTRPTAPNGYQFGSWQVTWTDGTHSDSLPTVSGDTMTIPANCYGHITVNAVWTELSYNITIDANSGNGGSASPNTYKISNGQQTVTLTQPTREGHTFDEWTVSWTDGDNSGTLPTVSGNTLIISANTYGHITVTATWTVNNYTIAKGSTTYGTFTVKVDGREATSADYGQIVTVEATPDKDYSATNMYYTVDGEGLVQHKFSGSFTMPAGNITVYVVFEKFAVETFALNKGATTDGSFIFQINGVEYSGDRLGAGVVVEVIASPNPNYSVSRVYYTTASGTTEVTLTLGKYTFTMPSADTTVYVEFQANATESNFVFVSADSGTTYRIVGYNGDYSGTIDIPSTYNGKDVVGINSGAFTQAGTFNVPSSIVAIESNAFVVGSTITLAEQENWNIVYIDDYGMTQSAQLTADKWSNFGQGESVNYSYYKTNGEQHTLTVVTDQSLSVRYATTLNGQISNVLYENNVNYSDINTSSTKQATVRYMNTIKFSTYPSEVYILYYIYNGVRYDIVPMYGASNNPYYMFNMPNGNVELHIEIQSSLYRVGFAYANANDKMAVQFTVGGIAVNNAFPAGTPVTIEITHAEGKNIAYIRDENGDLELTYVALNKYSFVMPARKVTLNILFVDGMPAIEGDWVFATTDGGATYTLVGYNGSGGDLVIPSTCQGNPVVAIADKVFKNKNITSVTIPASVTSIGDSAFYECIQLATVTFESGSQLQSIGYSAFTWCRSLTEITIPASVTSIGDSAFQDCSKLATITFESGSQLQTIGNSAFSWCDSLTDIYFGGTEDRWNGISGINSAGISSSRTTIHFMGGDIQYNINKGAETNGTFSVSLGSAAAGATITVTPAPNSGYMVSKVYYIVTGDDQQITIPYANGQYSFEMPANNITVYVEFVEINTSGTEGLEYTYNGSNGYTVTGYTGSESSVIIPDSYTGAEGTYPVVGIDTDAFAYTTFTTLQLPATLQTFDCSGWWANSITTLIIPNTSIEILEGGLGSYRLTTIYFLGSVAEWEQLITSKEYVGLSDSVQVICTDGQPVSKYSITLANVNNGSAQLSSTAEFPNTVINVDVTLDSSYHISQIYYVLDGTSEQVSLTYNSGNKFSFVMPSNDVTVYVIIKEANDDFVSYTYDQSLGGYVISSFNCEWPISHIVLPDTYNDNTNGEQPVKKIAANVFANKVGIIDIKLPAQLEIIDNGAFYASKLISITIPASVISIGSSFNLNTKLETVIFESGSQLQTIGNNAFSSCDALTDIHFGGTKAQWNNVVTDPSAIGISYDQTTVHCTDGKIPDTTLYTISKGAETNGTFSVSLGSAVAGATITVTPAPNSGYMVSKVYYIVENDDQEVTISNTSGQYNFQMPANNITVYVEFVQINTSGTEGLEYTYNGVDGYTVTGYTGSATDIVIPDTYNDTIHGELPVTEILIDAGVSYNQSPFINATSVVLPLQLQSIGNYTFAYNNVLTSITIPASVTIIDKGVFLYSSIATVIFESSNQLQTIGNEAFNGCSELQSITIPASVTTINDYAFSSCSQLATVTFEGNSQLQTIGNSAFYNCGSLTEITIPASVTTIGNSAFYYCSQLATVTFEGDALTSIGYSAFYNTDLTTINFAGTQAEWEAIEGITNAGIPEGCTINYEVVPTANSVVTMALPTVGKND